VYRLACLGAPRNHNYNIKNIYKHGRLIHRKQRNVFLLFSIYIIHFTIYMNIYIYMSSLARSSTPTPTWKGLVSICLTCSPVFEPNLPTRTRSSSARRRCENNRELFQGLFLANPGIYRLRDELIPRTSVTVIISLDTSFLNVHSTTLPEGPSNFSANSARLFPYTDSPLTAMM